MLAAAVQIAPPLVECTYDRQALLALSPTAFDQDLQGGWRPLAQRPECLEVAADLLAQYRQAQWANLTPGDLHSNYWHEGQLRAELGQKDRAIRLLLAGVNPNVLSDGFSDYALGTVAFLNNEMEGLQAARTRLMATPEPANWAETSAGFRERFGAEMKWPINLNVLDGLVACFGRPYKEAYGVACQTIGAETRGEMSGTTR